MDYTTLKNRFCHMDYKEQFYNMVKQYGKLIPYYVLQLLVGG